MKKLLIALFCLFASPAFAQGSSAEDIVLGKLTTTAASPTYPVWVPITTANPLNITCTNCGSGGSFAVQATTSNATIYPLMVTGTGAAVTTGLIDLASPFDYNASTGLVGILGITTTSLTNNDTTTLSGTTTISGALNATATATFSGLTTMSLTSTGNVDVLSVTLTGSGNTGDAGLFTNTATATGYALVVNGNSSIPTYTHALGAVTTYTIQASDMGLQVTASGSSADAITLPQAGTAGFAAGVGFAFMNLGSGVQTITPQTSTVNGLSSIVFAQGQGGYFLSDGTNYTANTGIGATTSGTINSGTTAQVAYYASSGTTLSGSSELAVVSTGVGIGTTTPAAVLDVESGSTNLLKLGSTTTVGVALTLADTATGAHNFSIGTNTGGASFANYLNVIDLTNSQNAFSITTTSSNVVYIQIPSKGCYVFANSSNFVAGSQDTGLCRAQAGYVAIGNGAQGNTSGRLQAQEYVGLSTAGPFAGETGLHSPSSNALALETTGSDGLIVTSAQLVEIPQIASDATHTDNTVCEDDTSHGLYSGSGTGGICLGTSSARYKNHVQPMIEGLAQIEALQPKTFYYNQGHGDNGVRLQYGFIAEDVASVLPNLVGLDVDGKPNTLDYMGIVPPLVHAVQQQQQEIQALSPGIVPYHRCLRWLPVLCAN